MNLPTKLQLANYAEILGATAQLHQDVFVLEVLNYLACGFFVEFGAADGFDMSNTWLLEKRFGWTGILAEPALCWHRPLAAGRACQIDHRAVWSHSDQQLSFCQPSDGNLASLAQFAGSDQFSSTRLASTSKTYEVPTVSLTDLLSAAPKTIDYLSMDAEGAEADILDAFDFRSHVFKVITCEHNHVEARRKRIHALLTAHNYERVCEDLSAFDDWYLHKSIT